MIKLKYGEVAGSELTNFIMKYQIYKLRKNSI